MHTEWIRSFIAIKLPGEIQEAILTCTLSLQRSCPPPLIRWVPVHNIHLTLKFLGAVEKHRLEFLHKDLVPILREIPCFSIVASGIGAFPNQRKPRIIWVGVNPSETLSELGKKIGIVVARFGVAPDEKDSSFHFTIGRVYRNASGFDYHRIDTALSQMGPTEIGSFVVKSVTIFRSDLTSSGAVYSSLASIPLAT